MSLRRFSPGVWLPLLLAPLFVLTWHFGVMLVSADRRVFLPGPGAVLEALVSHRAELASAALHTGLGAVTGFACAIVASVLCACLLSLSRWVRLGLSPYLMMLQLTPIVVLAPVLVIWVGAGFRSVALITFLICVFPLIVNTTQGLISVDRNLVDLFRLARASRWQELRRLRFPAALPYFFTGLRIAATLAPIGAVVGDFTAGDSASAGLGFLTIIYSANYRYPELFAAVLANAALGFLFTGLVVLMARRALGHWHESYHRQDQ